MFQFFIVGSAIVKLIGKNIADKGKILEEYQK